jgi:hypothetical protein
VLSLFPGLHDTGFDVAPENVALELSKDGQHAGKRVAVGIVRRGLRSRYEADFQRRQLL